VDEVGGLSSSPGPSLDNTVCEGAFDIATVIGIPFFGEITEKASVALVDTCEVVSRNGVGVWYRVEGDGTRLVASTCNGTSFDSQISIYSGSCGKLQCVAGNDQMETCGNGDQSQVAFYTKPKTMYYIYVHVRRSTLGIFKLSVDHLDANDECDEAVTLEYSGELIFGSTRGATIDKVVCDGESPSAPGVWYSIDGDGYRMDAILLAGDNTEFKGSYYVFKGSGCGDLECVTNRESSWNSEVGGRYFILVHGEGVLEGDFQIDIGDPISQGFDRLSPNNCTLPVNLVPGFTLDGESTYNRDRYDVESCGNLVFSTASGTWYSTIGTGVALTVSTCNSSTNFDTQISVFRGSCDDLQCVDGNDQACGDQSSVSWFSEEGEPYFILGKLVDITKFSPDIQYFHLTNVLVHGFRDATGRFNIFLEDYNIIVSEQCDSSIDAPTDGTSILGTTKGALSEKAPSCADTTDNWPGVWYQLTGTGRTMAASTCQSSAQIPSYISIYSGECASLTCVDAIQIPCGSQTSTTWTASVDVKYFVFIQAQGEDEMNPGEEFVLYIEETTPNDLCSNAIGLLLVDNSLTFGSTRSATIEEAGISDMDTSPRGRGTWYTVVGLGRELTATTCSEFTSFETSLSVFRGSCDSLVRVETVSSEDDCEYFGSIVHWSSDEDELYYLLVSGSDISEYGNFALSIAGSPNDLCFGAVGLLPSGSSGTLGATFDATPEYLGWCNGYYILSPGVWYSTVGTGESMNASTCHDASDFETRISIFRGGCTSLKCVNDGESLSCGLQTAVTWQTTVGEQYFILVHGVGVGNFGLSLDIDSSTQIPGV
jgi:hypothetical protein